MYIYILKYYQSKSENYSLLFLISKFKFDKKVFNKITKNSAEYKNLRMQKTW